MRRIIWRSGARLLSGWLCLLMLMPASPSAARSHALTPAVQRALDTLPPGAAISVIVHLADRADPSDMRNVEARLRQHAETAQASILAWLHAQQSAGRVESVTPFWIFNGLAVTASRDVILALAERPDVARISLDEIIPVPAIRSTQVSVSPIEPAIPGNLAAIRAPEAWARGVTGKGVVVALLDSGVDMTHPELAARWRGGASSWFDPYGEHPDAPFDSDGHGTQTLGVILGGDASGSPIGVAPDAQWIAAKIFNDRDRATIAAVHQALQWVIDPDGDPATPDAPHIVNNSWSFVNPGCDLEFADDLRALRAAGILPVFAAGLRGSISPANTPEAFAVGALADANRISRDSPSGPSVCEGVAVFPRVVAPGNDIHTADRFGFYTLSDGTSLAAAHVSGALALLLDADPTLTADEQARLLTETAVDLGDPGPDNVYGYGRIDIAAALDRVLGPDPARVVSPQVGSDAIIAIGGVGVVLAAVLIVWGARRRRSTRLA